MNPLHFWSRTRSRSSIRPTVEVLEDRMVPASISVGRTRVTIRGDSGINQVSIRDNGDGDLRINISGRPRASATTNNIQEIFIDTREGNDLVTYSQSGLRTRNLLLHASLGNGDDTFQAVINGMIPPERGLFLGVEGGSQKDSIAIKALVDVHGPRGLGILPTSVRGLVINAVGGDDNDTITLSFQGINAGNFEAKAEGGPGDDRIEAVLNRAPGSSGSVILSLNGAPGADSIGLLQEGVLQVGATPINLP